MKLAELIGQKFTSEGGSPKESVRVENGKIPTSAKVGFFSAAIAVGLATGITLNHMNHISTENANEIIKSHTVSQLADRNIVHAQHNFSVSPKLDFSDGYKSHMTQNGLFCEITLDKRSSLDRSLNGEYADPTKEEMFAYQYVHEQAHCLDVSHYDATQYTQYLFNMRNDLDKDHVSLSREQFADAYSTLSLSLRDFGHSDKVIDNIRSYRMAEKDSKHMTVPAIDDAKALWESRKVQLIHLSQYNMSEADRIVSIMATMISAKHTKQMFNDYGVGTTDVSLPAMVKVFDEEYKAAIFLSGQEPILAKDQVQDNQAVHQSNFMDKQFERAERAQSALMSEANFPDIHAQKAQADQIEQEKLARQDFEVKMDSEAMKISASAFDPNPNIKFTINEAKLEDMKSPGKKYRM